MTPKPSKSSESHAFFPKNEFLEVYESFVVTWGDFH